MKLVLYSGGQDAGNHVLHEALTGLAGKKSKIRMTYLAFCAENANIFYQRFVRRYRSHGVSDFSCFILDEQHTEAEIKNALRTDIIYISGGNTFYILAHLKRLRLLSHLRSFVEKGGVLAGLSAGAIIMTPRITLAGYPRFEADENEVGLANLRSLGLVGFEFYPHYSNSKRLNKALLLYSRRVKSPVYACADGDGIIINESNFTAKGSVYIFHQGTRFSLA